VFFLYCLPFIGELKIINFLHLKNEYAIIGSISSVLHCFYHSLVNKDFHSEHSSDPVYAKVRHDMQQLWQE